MTSPDLKCIVEAVLFAADTPVPLDTIVEIVGEAKRSDVRDAIAALAAEYDGASRPFAVTEVAGGWQLYCRPEYLRWVRELHRGRMPTRLSQAALETLAIIAYKQPIVRAEVEIIRGVDSSGVLATLLRRNLVAIAGRAPGMGRALMYRTTKEFLRYFGLNAITDLPRLEEFAEVLGLRPDELELAIEGAESLAGVSAGNADAGGDDTGEEDGATDDHDGPGAAPGEEPMEAETRAEAIERSEDDRTTVVADDGELVPAEPDAPVDEDEAEVEHAVIIVPGAAGEVAELPPILPGPDGGVHPVPDRKILDPTDET